MTETPGERAPAKRAVPADSFAHRLMLARAHAGHMSIREAAELTGLGRGAWTHWEKGGMPVDRDYVIEVISDKLGVDPVWLSEGGALAEPETRPGRRKRWSTVRPAAHTQAHRKLTGPEGGQAMQANLRMPDQVPTSPVRTMPDRPRDTRPAGRPPKSAPNPATRRPVRV